MADTPNCKNGIPTLPRVRALLPSRGEARSPGEIAVVFDVAGTILRMYRVAKEIDSGTIIDGIVTADLVMEKEARALVVPQVDPSRVMSCPPDAPIYALIREREECVQVSCSSTPVTRDRALEVLRSSRARVGDMQDAHRAVRSRCPDGYQTTGMIVDAELGEVSYAISTAGQPFPGLDYVLRRMEDLGVEVYVASGDSRRSLEWLTRLGLGQGRIYPVSTPSMKAEIVRSLKKSFSKVVMIGDGLNDIHAMKAADVGILTIQQDSHPPPALYAAADQVIDDISDLPELLESLWSI